MQAGKGVIIYVQLSLSLFLGKLIRLYSTYNLTMCGRKIISKVRRVGNSLTVVIPAEEAKARQINEGDVVQIEIQRKVNIRDLFGSVRFSKTSQEMKEEDRKKGWGN